uniref:GED domain-containing protein n=1 Tax=Sphenodon punctatus TaxID=8508 RepID=A0A8D0GCF4_SPHPU
MIITQFKMEHIVYCQDSIYSGDLKEIRKNPGVFLPLGVAVTHVNNVASQKQLSVDEMAYHLNAYFKTAGNRLATQVPLIIQSYVLQDYAEKLQNAMMLLLQDREGFRFFLGERKDTANIRNSLKNRIQRLTQARQRLAKFPV